MIYERFQQLVQTDFPSLLSERGFIKKGDLFYNRSSKEIGWVVEITPSIKITEEEMEFMLETSVFLPAIYEIVMNQKAFDVPEKLETGDILYKSIADLKGNKKHMKYRLNELYVDLPKLIKTVEEDIDEFVLPHFQQLTSMEKLIEKLGTNNYVDRYLYKGILLGLQGDTAASKELLLSYKQGWDDDSIQARAAEEAAKALGFE
ncbi:hypothetical protein [Bacillus taeanensis]|uniref:DUF4304 domain-containing protein n=1 Tax=Bacillus taeanensis TaxID=273032 RepID=A0A366Y0C5_9BACI|nr:hypothetical protein [Bacillus taeanensis]RBW69611.1 hypothetical protein DS031_10300 [Bacillus taeanensis]